MNGNLEVYIILKWHVHCNTTVYSQVEYDAVYSVFEMVQ